MRNRSNKNRLAEVAHRQFGCVNWAQLRDLGLDRALISRWQADGYLHKVLPHVYAVGHRALTIEAELAAALLYAGPGAALSHATAAWWLGLLEDRPRNIQVTTPRQCRSLHGIGVYGRRERTRILRRGLTVTPVPEMLIDLAATAPRRTLRRVLANAEFHRVLDLEAVERAMSRGTHGASKLRAALETHQPRLAYTKSELERMLVAICEQENIPLPEINTKVNGWEVDALWREAKLAVELDGYGNHHTPAQLRRDRRKEMALRAMGFTVIRYSEDQLKERHQVAAELRVATRRP
jgi:very-short-patch-repair endonuclease